MFPNLFSPGRIRGLTVANRVIMPAMGTNLASACGEPTAGMVAYYLERARGGAGLIIIENTCVDYPLGRSGAVQLRVDQDRFIPGLASLVEVLHSTGCKVAIQLNHAGGSASRRSTEGLQPVAPSQVSASDGADEPRALERLEIEEVARKFAAAARRAKRAGFDAVEIHGAHSYLIAQFMSPLTNRRTDEFGGDLAGRMRFPLLVVSLVREAVGNNFPVLFRFSADEFVPGGRTAEEAPAIAKLLEKAGVDLLDVSAGCGFSMDRQLEPSSYDDGWRVYLAAQVKRSVNIPVATAGVIRTPELAEEVVRSGYADFVCIGRGLIADPAWAAKAQAGLGFRIRPCLSCNQGCVSNRVFFDLPIRCSVNPFAGRELVVGERGSSGRRLRLLVVGGGPAGMQAAIFAAQRGHEVWLVERCGHLGGKLVAASAPPHKHRVRLFLEYLKAEIEASSVNVAVGREDATDVARQLRPDAVIVATGASPLVPEIPGVKTGMERGEVLLAEDVLGRGLTFPGRKLAVAGGGMVGCETAEYLASQGADVTILEMTRELASDVEPISRSALLQRIEHLGIKVFAGHALASWSAGTILTDQGVALQADLLVLALGYRPSASTAEEWARYGRYVFPIGDARRPGRILDATGDAVECVCELERRLD